MTQKPQAHHRASPLLIHEPPLQVLPSLAVAVGLNEAIVLQQIHYWLQRSQNEINGHLWVYNSVAEWKKQFPFWSDDTIARTLKSLRQSGVVVAEQLSKEPRDRSLYYRIDYAALAGFTTATCGNGSLVSAECIDATCGNGLRQSAVMHSRKMTESLYKTETTSETTQSNTPQPPATPGAERDTAGAAFDAFWKTYPKKVGKDAAAKVWARKVKADDVQAVMDALDKQRSSEQWNQDGGRFIPHPSTWLNQGRWKDEELADDEQPRSKLFAGVL